MSEAVKCPFCDESDFDLIGLKAHFLRGRCEPFNNTVRPDEDRFEKPSHRMHTLGRTKAGNDIGGI